MKTLPMFYNSLNLSHINYGILAWGHDCKRIFKLQKKSVRIISVRKYNAHTEPIFKDLNFLKIGDIYTLNELEFYHKYINNNLPYYFQALALNPNLEIHDHNTRHRENLHIRRTNPEFAKMCVRHNVLILVNNIDRLIKDQFQTHSLQGFTRYMKNKFVQQYAQSCTIINCYVCEGENV